MMPADVDMGFRVLFIGGMLVNWAWEKYLRVRKGWALHSGHRQLPWQS